MCAISMLLCTRKCMAHIPDVWLQPLQVLCTRHIIVILTRQRAAQSCRRDTRRLTILMIMQPLIDIDCQFWTNLRLTDAITNRQMQLLTNSVSSQHTHQMAAQVLMLRHATIITVSAMIIHDLTYTSTYKCLIEVRYVPAHTLFLPVAPRARVEPQH